MDEYKHLEWFKLLKLIYLSFIYLLTKPIYAAELQKGSGLEASGTSEGISTDSDGKNRSDWKVL